MLLLVQMKQKKQTSSEKLYKYTIKIPRDIAQEARKLAIDKEISFAQLVEEAIREKVEKEKVKKIRD